NPDITSQLRDPILSLLRDKAIPPFPFHTSKLLTYWGQDRLQTFIDRCLEKSHSTDAANWLSDQVECLSPYILPIPVMAHERAHMVQYFERRGFVSVV